MIKTVRTGLKRCTHCGGSGHYDVIKGTGVIHVPCANCEGSGRTQ